MDVVTLVAVLRNDMSQVIVESNSFVVGRETGCVFVDQSFFVARRKNGNQISYFLETFFFRRHMEMCHTTFGSVDIGTTKSFGSNVFVGYCFDNGRTGNKHLADIIDHKDKICDTR